MKIFTWSSVLKALIIIFLEHISESTKHFNSSPNLVQSSDLECQKDRQESASHVFPEAKRQFLAKTPSQIQSSPNNDPQKSLLGPSSWKNGSFISRRAKFSSNTSSTYDDDAKLSSNTSSTYDDDDDEGHHRATTSKPTVSFTKLHGDKAAHLNLPAMSSNVVVRAKRNGEEELFTGITDNQENGSSLTRESQGVRELEEYEQLDDERSELGGDYEGEAVCRSWETLLPVSLYLFDVTAWCYLYTSKETSRDAPQRVWRPMPLVFQGHRVTVLTNPHNRTDWEWAKVSSEVLQESLLTVGDRGRWERCVEAAMDCCNASAYVPSAGADNTCPHTWDRLQCWPASPNGSVNFQRCPEYMILENPCGDEDGFAAKKECDGRARWTRVSGHEWTNFSNCVVMRTVHENIMHAMKWHVAVCSLSVIALLPALVIFFSYRQLQVKRITLHKHLFLSLLLESLCTILMRTMQMFYDSVIDENGFGCILLSISLKYLRQSNFMWFFNEGFYLHRLLASAFSDQKNFFLFYGLGWLVPAIPVGVYCLLRTFHFATANHCLILPQEEIEWLLMVAPMAAILVNLVFLVNIIRILVMKLKANDISQYRTDIGQYRKMVRATFMVVPLFGLQFLLTIYRPNKPRCTWINVYFIVNHVIEGSTGAMVAVIFCYMNNEVRALLKKDFDSWCPTAPGGCLSRVPESIHLKSRNSMTTAHTTINTEGSPRTNTNKSFVVKHDEPKTVIVSRDELGNHSAIRETVVSSSADDSGRKTSADLL